jgi:hypothetical protein
VQGATPRVSETLSRFLESLPQILDNDSCNNRANGMSEQHHHMHDANQDRLLIQRMTYFRVKRLCLGEAYAQFLEESLAPGSTVILAERQIHRPATHYETLPTVNGMITGALLTGDSLVRGRTWQKFDGGWSVLWSPANGYRI